MKSLADQSLLTYDTGSKAISKTDIKSYLGKLNNWEHHSENKIDQISKTFTFKNFIEALSFTNTIAALAEQENHHPKICLQWGRVKIRWWTHSVNGLFINDFIMAAKCDEEYSKK